MKQTYRPVFSSGIGSTQSVVKGNTWWVENWRMTGTEREQKIKGKGECQQRETENITNHLTMLRHVHRRDNDVINNRAGRWQEGGNYTLGQYGHTYEVFRRCHTLTARRQAHTKAWNTWEMQMQKLQDVKVKRAWRLTCAWTRASLKRMNQLTENLPAFCSVRALLLLSQMSRRWGFLSESCQHTKTHSVPCDHTRHLEVTLRWLYRHLAREALPEMKCVFSVFTFSLQLEGQRFELGQAVLQPLVITGWLTTNIQRMKSYIWENIF